MHCYQHQEHAAVGLCKACHKAVCITCAKDTGKGLACGELCFKEVLEQNQIIEKSKLLYSIGTKSKLPATSVLIYISMGALFSILGFFPLIVGERPEPTSALMGVFFLLIGIFSYVRNRKLNIDC